MDKNIRSAIFLKNKVLQSIKYNGIKCVVKRKMLNEFNEPIRDTNGKYVYTQVGKFDGLYHTTNNYITETIAESSKSYSVQSPMIMAILETAPLLEVGDIIEANKLLYELQGVNDVSRLGVVIDLSLLEVV